MYTKILSLYNIKDNNNLGNPDLKKDILTPYGHVPLWAVIYI